MDLSLLTNNLPFVAVIAGVLLFAWSQKSKISGFFSGLASKVKKEKKSPDFSLTPSERFEIFYALRSWCEVNAYDDAVRALDDCVLPTIVSLEETQEKA